MANIGSVFLGDVQRSRLRSSGSTPGSTPPSSPPPTVITTRGASHSTATTTTNSAVPGVIQEQEKSTLRPQLTPTQSLEVRVRWLEAIIHGAMHDELHAGLSERKPELKRGETLMRAAEHTQRRMNDLAGTLDVLRRFIGHYEHHAQYLTPAFALSGTLPTMQPPEYKDMSHAELAALAAELEPDIRAADQDMREIHILQQKGMTGAGTLSGHEVLQPRLEALLLRHKEDLDRAAALERRVAGIVRQYAMQVDKLSELFVAWDDTLRVVEDRVGRLDKEREERLRRGYE
ncbi:hypothetical protein F5148DRAFT_1336490 [Russula earlei]|uniref:Uncharacterized protein n=1 Tax=Russula earlei TaxID=71964 RepID=A0ACC0TVH9_9AGAM|nr:hypothetical protein F5148DRAFT_1336490 [Russula earlei]